MKFRKQLDNIIQSNNLTQKHQIYKKQMQQNKNNQNIKIQQNIQKIQTEKNKQNSINIIQKPSLYNFKCKQRTIIKILSFVITILQFLNIILLNFIEYNNKQIILQIFIAFIILPIGSISIHIAFLYCLLQSNYRNNIIQIVNNIKKQQNIDTTRNSNPIFLIKRSNKLQDNTTKKEIFDTPKTLIENAQTIKKFKKNKQQPIQLQKIKDLTILKLYVAISRMFNILINLIFAIISIIIMINNQSFTGMVMAQIIFQFAASLLNIGFTYYCYIHQDNKVNNNVLENQQVKQCSRFPLRTRGKKTSLDQQIKQQIINQNSVKNEQINQQIDQVINQQDVQESQPKIIKIVSICLDEETNQPINIIQKQNDQKYLVQSLNSPNCQKKQQEKKSILKLSTNEVLKKTKSIVGDTQKKKVEINFKHNEVFEYSDICPSEDSVKAKENIIKAIQDKKKQAKNLKKNQMKMQLQFQLLNKKRSERHEVQNKIKLKQKYSQRVIKSNYHQDQEIDDNFRP